MLPPLVPLTLPVPLPMLPLVPLTLPVPLLPPPASSIPVVPGWLKAAFLFEQAGSASIAATANVITIKLTRFIAIAPDNPSLPERRSMLAGYSRDA
jgi:hypothetical protein